LSSINPMSMSLVKSVIYLDPNPNPKPYQSPLAELIKGKDRGEISRAALDLKKAIVYLNAITGGATSSLPTMVALNLPDKLLALLWIAHALFNEQFFHSDYHLKYIDHDSRMVFRGMTHLSSKHWQEEIVSSVSFLTAAAKASFPLGHPQPEKFYRQHPIKPTLYYPVNLFHSLLREERERELIQLLSDLGANKITIQNQANSGGSLESDSEALLRSADCIFEFPGKRWVSDLKFDSAQYPWLAYEPTWQTIAYTRVHQGISSASLELTIDIANEISGQIDQIENLAAEYKSINVDSLAALRGRVLQPQRLWVTFPAEV
ncbi:MAG TPA: hypothetical protein V6C65_39075, partial [Allocoleopsis sp.]